MSEPGKPAFEHLVRAAQELALALTAGVSALGGTRPALERVRAGIRAEEKRWAERAAHDPAAERVREIFATLSDVLAASERVPKSRKSEGFDRPRMRWDTRK